METVTVQHFLKRLSLTSVIVAFTVVLTVTQIVFSKMSLFEVNHLVFNPKKFHYVVFGNNSHTVTIFLSRAELEISYYEKLLGFSLVMKVFDMKVSGKQIKNKMIFNKEAIILGPKFDDFQRRFLSMWVMRLCGGRFN